MDFTSDVYTVDVQLQNVEYDSNIIAVTYDNGAATGFDMDTISAGDTEKTFSVNADSVNVVKVFIWDSLNGMRPLCEAKTVEIQ